MNYTFWIPVIISIFALYWNYRQQLSIEKLKRENEKDKLIHRIQFEKEFEIYNELWGKLVDLRNQTVALRPEFDSLDPNKTKEEIEKERLMNLNEAFSACIISFEKNKPFYIKEVYDEIEKAIKLSRKEVNQLRYGDNKTDEYWKKAEQNIAELIASIDKTCEIIRHRIGLIRVKK